MGRRIIAIVLATVIALVGVTTVWLYVRGADARAVAQQRPTVTYLAAQAVPAGTTLGQAVQAGLIRQTTAAAKGVPAGALTQVTASNEKLVATSDIQPGEFVTSARFGDTPAAQKAIQVPKGMVAISVELTDPARVGTFVTPGTRIAIFDSYQIKAIGTDPKSKALNDAGVKGTSLLLGDVLVIGMGQTALSAPRQNATEATAKDAAAQQESSPSFLVTVAVTPKDAARLVHGINNGTLYAALRGDNLDMSVPEVNDLNIFDLSGVSK